MWKAEIETSSGSKAHEIVSSVHIDWLSSWAAGPILMIFLSPSIVSISFQRIQNSKAHILQTKWRPHIKYPRKVFFSFDFYFLNQPVSLDSSKKNNVFFLLVLFALSVNIVNIILNNLLNTICLPAHKPTLSLYAYKIWKSKKKLFYIFVYKKNTIKKQ